MININNLDTSRLELLIFDMDGVIYKGSEPIEHVIESINRFYKKHKKVIFFTNNSTLSPHDYADKLTKMDIICHPEQIYTSSTISAKSLSEKYESEITAYVVGEKGLIEALEANNIKVINKILEPTEIIENPSINCTFVIAGLDKTLTYKKLAAATILINRNSKFYATNDDSSLPDKYGFLPGAGSIVKAISTATGIEPEKVFGKPSPAGIFQILKQTKVDPSKAIMIGDRLNTDILCAKNAGINSALVLTGVTSEKDIHCIPKKYSPDIIIKDLREL